MGALGGVLGGCAPQQASENQGTGIAEGNGYMPAQWDEEADIVIVGGGGAGGAAAYAGRKAGVDVLVLESQSSTTFSSTALSGDSICFVGTEEQAAAGIEDSAEAFMQECLELGEHANKEEVIQTYLDHNLEYYEILKEIGVQFEGVVMLDTYTPRTLNFSSAEHQQLLTEATQELGARYLFETSGKRLYVDAAGTVCGVEASKDGKTIAVKARKAVLMCTGGITRNKEMLDECIAGLGDVDAGSGVGNTGEGHIACLQLGSKFHGRPSVYSPEGMHPGSVSMEGFAQMYDFGAIKVNINGDRFMDESLGWCAAATRATLEQPQKDGRYFNWQIVDQIGYDLAKECTDTRGVREENEGYFVSAPSLEELQNLIGAPNLVETVNRYNSDIIAGNADAQGRTTLTGKGSDAIRPLDSPPYYAYANVPVITFAPTVGIEIDGEGRALDQYGNPIGNDRLYLAGEIMLRNLIGNKYKIFGLAVGGGCTFGVYCANKAAQLENWDA